MMPISPRFSGITIYPIRKDYRTDPDYSYLRPKNSSLVDSPNILPYIRIALTNEDKAEFDRLKLENKENSATYYGEPLKRFEQKIIKAVLTFAKDKNIDLNNLYTSYTVKP